jgi:hypothetical protein
MQQVFQQILIGQPQRVPEGERIVRGVGVEIRPLRLR